MIPYSLHVALLLALCLLFYKGLLQNETYHKLNRFVLLICIALCFLLPLIEVPQAFSLQRNLSVPYFGAGITNVNTTTDRLPPAKSHTDLSGKQLPVIIKETTAQKTLTTVTTFQSKDVWLKAIRWIYWFGVGALALNFMLQMVLLLIQIVRNPVIKDGIYRIVEIKRNQAPCSFGNYIFINPEKYDWETYEQIMMHEKIHIKQGHSFDLVMAELMLIIQWFNPFAWLYRKEIESNLEFLTDHSLITTKQVEPETYQLSLLKVAVPNYSIRVVTSYNQSLLKRRIEMMNARRSGMHILWKYIMIIPVLIVLTCSLNTTAAVNSPSTNKKSLIVNHTKIDDKRTPQDVVVKTESDRNDTHLYKSTAANLSHVTVESLSLKDTITRHHDAGINKGQVASDSHKGFTAKDLINLQDHGISNQYIQAIANAGYTNFTTDDIISLDSHGISGQYIQAIANAGYRNFTADDIISLDSHGISGQYIQAIANAGYANFTADDIISLDSHGISGQYIQAIANAGYKNFIVDDIINLDSHGISGQYVQAIANAGYRNFIADDIITLDSHDIKGQYIQAIANAGYKNFIVDDIINLDSHDISGQYIQAIANAGYKNFIADDIITLDSHGISGQYIQAIANAGYRNFIADDIITLDSHGVSGQYIQAIANAGYKNFTVKEILNLQAHGVSPESLKRKGKQ